MRRRIVDAADGAGRDPAEIICIYNIEVRVGHRVGTDPSVVSGPEAIVERPRRFTDLGFSGFNFMVGESRRERASRAAGGGGRPSASPVVAVVSRQPRGTAA